jgi:hypothetical protein
MPNIPRAAAQLPSATAGSQREAVSQMLDHTSSGNRRDEVPKSVPPSVGFLSFFDRFATPPILLVLR